MHYEYNEVRREGGTSPIEWEKTGFARLVGEGWHMMPPIPLVFFWNALSKNKLFGYMAFFWSLDI